MRDALRELPPVDAIAAQIDAPRAIAVAAARAVLGERRAELLAGDAGQADLAARAREWAARAGLPRLRRVLNATGVIVHTNLGRAPLAEAARAAVARAAEGYSNLELDLGSGARGSRHDHVEELLCSLTGAEAAIAVNNCAGATLLAAAALAGRAGANQVIVSRGQLVEIGGGFRVPEVIAQAGARLVEVGTTNRTRRGDYARAIGDATGAILRAHPSNFRQLGFVQEVEIEELCELGVPVIDDVGSGVLADELEPLREEPAVRRSVRAGAALVCFSGDKLLGGPQAGIIVGRADLIAKIKKHPLARAVRADKVALAGITATLLHYLKDEAEREIPIWRMISMTRKQVKARAETWRKALEQGEVIESESTVGGGSLPGESMKTWVLALDVKSPDKFMARLRASNPPVIARTENDRILLDPRTVLPEQDALLMEILSSRIARMNE